MPGEVYFTKARTVGKTLFCLFLATTRETPLVWKPTRDWRQIWFSTQPFRHMWSLPPAILATWIAPHCCSKCIQARGSQALRPLQNGKNWSGCWAMSIVNGS